MKLHKRHRDKLIELQESLTKDIKNNEPITYTGGFCWANDVFIDKILEDVNTLDYVSLYPNIVVMLYDEGFVDKSESENIEKIRYFLNNRKDLKLDIAKYSDYKTFVNAYFGYLNNRNIKINSELSKGLIISALICYYTKLLYEETLEINQNIIYIDTDRIFYIGDINLGDIDLESTKNRFDVLIMKQKKRYVAYDGHNITMKGVHKMKREEVENQMRSIIRNKKLNELGL